jgi:D-sedoheptulose 7-phosphate isomerase
VGGEALSGERGSLEARIADQLEESVAVGRRVIDDERGTIAAIAEALIEALRAGNTVLLFGNGGSAADSQHIAAELVSRFRRERRALAAIALTVDTSVLTSIANDDAFENVFARQIEALGRRGDVAVGISTSGRSPNVLKGLETARRSGLTTIALTGASGLSADGLADICLRVPSESTPRIQEAHIAVAHAICEVVEEELAGDDG